MPAVFSSSQRSGRRFCSQLTSGANGAPRRLTYGNAGHQQMAERPRPALVEQLQQLRLELGHVHVAGALRLARLAHQAEVEDVVDPLTSQFAQRLLAGHRQPQGVGPAARAVVLVERRPERRAHRPALRLAAGAVAVAHLDGADEALLLVVVEDGRRLDRAGSRGRSEGSPSSRGASTILPGLSRLSRVERRLDLAERLVDRRAEHLFVPLAARQAVAVLAAERAAILQHQVGDVLGDAPHPRHVVGVLEVQQRADVQAADAGVAVEGAVGAVALQRLAEAGDELRQPLRATRRCPRRT